MRRLSLASSRRLVLAVAALALAGVALMALPSATAPAMPAPNPCAVLGGPPANDNYGAASSISTPSSGSGNNLCATLESGENIPCCAEDKTVWFAFTPGFDGIGVVHTCGSNFDTVVAVYDGTSVSDPEIAYNDDAQGTGPCQWTVQSYLEFPCDVGVTYHIQIGGFGGANGNYQYDLSGCDGSPPPPCPGPANNCFANPEVVAGVPYTNTQNTAGATNEPGEPQPCGGIGATVWYEWTSPADGKVIVDTFGSGFDTVLAAYTGNSLMGLTQLACNDDFPWCCQSQIEFYCQAGVTYRIQVGGYFGSTGPLQLNIGDCLPAPPPPPPFCGYTIESPAAFDWVELDPALGGAGTGIPSWDDSAWALTPDPAFTFNLCGIDYETFWMSSNGNICMGPTFAPTGDMFSYPPDCWNYWGVSPLPDGWAPHAMVYGYWTDLNPSMCPGGTGMTCHFYALTGTAPERVLIVEWSQVPYFGFGYPGDHTFQIKLFEKDSCIEVHYRDVVGGLWYPTAAGFESADSAAGWTYAHDWSGFSRSNQAWRACPVPPLTAVEDAFTFNEDDTMHPLDVLANDINASGTPITITGVGAASKGTSSLVAGEVRYQPWPDQNGDDSFEYSIVNEDGEASTGTVVITINPVNDAPSFTAEWTHLISTPRDGAQWIPGWAYDVQSAPLAAGDEAAQEVTFELTYNDVPAIFAEDPQLRRSGSSMDMNPVQPPVSGSFGVVHFVPSGVSGASTLCYIARDNGGTDVAVNTWGETAQGVDESDTPYCLDITQNAAPVAYFEPTSEGAMPRAGVLFDACPGPAPRCTFDADGVIVTRLWEFGDGISSSAESPMHVYPLPGVYQVRLSVWDDHGVVGTYHRDVAVTVPDAADPEVALTDELSVEAGRDLTVFESAHVQMVAIARGSEATYQWRQVHGPPVALDDATSPTPRFQAPRLVGSTPIDLQFEVLALAGELVSAPDYLAVHVVSANQVPIADAGGRMDATLGDLVILDGAASADPDGDALVYRWEQIAQTGDPLVELVRPDTATPSFEAPAQPATIRFRLVVSDGKATSEDLAIVVVAPAPAQAVAEPAPQAPGMERAVAENARAESSAALLLAGALFATLAAVAAVVLVRKFR